VHQPRFARPGPPEPDPERLEGWRLDQTGFPPIAACMRALPHTGWTGFHMGAMLVSFSGRSFAWRRRWARCWAEVRYCSDACSRGRGSGG
jgi:deoxyribodipyrimidine photolyase